MSVSDIQMRNEEGEFQSIFPITVEQGGTWATDGETALNNLGAKDFVIAEGTSGDWKYRKWNSGKAECECKITATVSIDKNWFFNCSDTIEGQSYPFEFVEVPSVQITANAAYLDEKHSILISCATTPNLSASKFPSFNLFHSQSQSQATYTVNCMAIGRWK